MALLVSDIITRARLTLLDTTLPTPYWSDDELIGWMNQFFADSVNARTDFFSAAIDVPLAAGVEQELPVGCSQLLRIMYNTGSGKRVLARSLEAISHAVPNWAGAAPAVDVINYIPDVTTPRRFSVFPPNTGSGEVKALAAQVPTPVTALTDPFPVADQYQGAAWAYIVGMALTKTTDRGDLGRSAAFLTIWSSSIKSGIPVEIQAAPKVDVMKNVS